MGLCVTRLDPEWEEDTVVLFVGQARAPRPFPEHQGRGQSVNLGYTCPNVLHLEGAADLDDARTSSFLGVADDLNRSAANTDPTVHDTCSL